MPKIKKYLPFIALFFLILLLRSPSFFEPHWYFDEGVYSVFGKSILEGHSPYMYVWDHKPLGIYLIYSLAYLVPFDTLFVAKFFAFLSAFGSSLVLFLIARQAFSRKAAFIAAFTFGISSSLTFFDGNQANGEIFILPFLLFSIYLIEPFNKSINVKKIFWAGIFLGIASSIKQVAGIDLALLTVLLLLKEGRFFKNLLVLIWGFSSTILLTAFITLLLGTPLPDFWFAVVKFNFSYVVSRKLGILFNFLKFSLLFLIPILFLVRSKIAYFPLVIWLVIDLIGVLSGGQPYPHYLIQVLPVVSLIFAVALTYGGSAKLLRFVATGAGVFFIFLLGNSYFRIVPYGDVFSEWGYYNSFVKTALSGNYRTFEEVFSSRWAVDRNKKVVEYLNKNSSKNDYIYIWGGGTTSWLYNDLDRKIPSRYISFLHAEAIPEAPKQTINDLKERKPKFIVTTPHPTFEELTSLIDKNYLLDKEIDDVTIFKLKAQKED